MAESCSRRRLLQLSGIGAVALAGCSAAPGSGSCDLHHEVSAVEDPENYSGEIIPYTNLSPDSKSAFDEARDSERHILEYDGENKPPDFSYSDETTEYVISYEDDLYELLTYTSEGCVVE